MSFIYDFINSMLVFLYNLSGNLGLTIIFFTAIVRLVLLPLTIPSLRTQQQMKKLQPELKALKNKHGSDKKALQEAQTDLYKKYNMNPLAGCLPQLVQLGLLIVLYHALTTFLKQTEIGGQPINTYFLWLHLGQTDPKYVIPVLAGLTQLVLSLMIVPATEVKDEVPNDSPKKAVQEANKKEEDIADMASTMQQQMLFMMPVMTGIFAARFPSGLGLYWIATTVFSIAQQYFISGPGGLVSYSQRAYQFIQTRVMGVGSTTLVSKPSESTAKKATTSSSPVKPVARKTKSKTIAKGKQKPNKRKK